MQTRMGLAGDVDKYTDIFLGGIDNDVKQYWKNADAGFFYEWN